LEVVIYHSRGGSHSHPDADAVAVMAPGGRLIEFGPPLDLLRAQGLYPKANGVAGSGGNEEKADRDDSSPSFAKLVRDSGEQVMLLEYLRACICSDNDGNKQLPMR
jgi:hypothetical protein